MVGGPESVAGATLCRGCSSCLCLISALGPLCAPLWVGLPGTQGGLRRSAATPAEPSSVSPGPAGACPQPPSPRETAAPPPGSACCCRLQTPGHWHCTRVPPSALHGVPLLPCPAACVDVAQHWLGGLLPTWHRPLPPAAWHLLTSAGQPLPCRVLTGWWPAFPQSARSERSGASSQPLSPGASQGHTPDVLGVGWGGG